MSTPALALVNLDGLQNPRVSQSVRAKRESRRPSAAPPSGPLMPLWCDWARMPSYAAAGQTRQCLKLQDEQLAYYAEQYQLFIAPWKHLVGTQMPNFYQFIAWHEQLTGFKKVIADLPS